MGYIIYLLSSRHNLVVTWPLLLFCIVVANIPDIDFLPGIIIGDPRRFHHGMSHSLVFAILFGFLIGFLIYFKKAVSFVQAFTLSFVLYFSHIFLDYMVLSSGRGVPLLWPLYQDDYMIPFVVFPYFDYMSPEGEFLTQIFSFHNLKTIALEILFLLPLLVIGLFVRLKRKGRKDL